MQNKIINLIKTFWVRLTFRKDPAPDRWVFSSVHNEAFNYNSSYLFLYVKEHCPDIHPYYIINDEALRKKMQHKYGEQYFIHTNTLAGIKKVLGCKVWFTSTAPPLYGMGFRRKYKIINLWHGVPLKKIGMEQENLSRLTRKYYKYLFADNYEAVLTTSQKLVPMMSRSFLVDQERIKVWGQPRNDMLFQKQNPKTVLRKIYDEDNVVKNGMENITENVPEFRKAVLYAPTFRDKEPTKLFPFSEFEDFGREQEGVTAQREEAMCQNKNISDSQEKLISWLEQEQIFLCIRMHLYDQTGYEWLKKLDVPGSRIRFLNEDRQGDIMEILNVFDLLVTDYSSIYIDYLLTGKPIVFLPYDQEKYLQERGMNFPYEKVTPGPKPKSLQEFLNSIHDLLYNHDGYVRQRADINDFFNTVQSPCCENICNYVRKIAAIEYK